MKALPLVVLKLLLILSTQPLPTQILLDHFNVFGLSRNNLFCRDQLKNEGGGGGIFDYAPYWGLMASWLGQTGICTTKSCIL